MHQEEEKEAGKGTEGFRYVEDITTERTKKDGDRKSDKQDTNLRRNSGAIAMLE